MLSQMLRMFLARGMRLTYIAASSLLPLRAVASHQDAGTNGYQLASTFKVMSPSQACVTKRSANFIQRLWRAIFAGNGDGSNAGQKAESCIAFSQPTGDGKCIHGHLSVVPPIDANDAMPFCLQGLQGLQSEGVCHLQMAKGLCKRRRMGSRQLC